MAVSTAAPLSETSRTRTAVTPGRELERRRPVDRIAGVLARVAADVGGQGRGRGRRSASPSSAQSRAAAPSSFMIDFRHVMELAHVVVDAAPDDQRLARDDRLRDALAAPQAADDRQRDAEVLAHQAREGVKRLFVLGRFDRVADQAAREAREHGAGVGAVAAFGPQRRALQERVRRLQRGAARAT